MTTHKGYKWTERDPLEMRCNECSPAGEGGSNITDLTHPRVTSG